MYPDYDDIRSRITEQPTWFGDNGVPRYGPFRPAMSNIYAKESACLEIACQGCDARALIGIDMDQMQLYELERLAGTARHGPRYPTTETPGVLVGYGDFPRGICDGENSYCPGVTMTTGVTRILEYGHATVGPPSRIRIRLPRPMGLTWPC